MSDNFFLLYNFVITSAFPISCSLTLTDFCYKGNDLYTDKTITCFQAIRGHIIKLKTLEDSIITVKVPAGTQHGTLLSVKGQGMPVHRTLNIRGNLYVKVMVLIPQLSAADLKKIKDL